MSTGHTLGGVGFAAAAAVCFDGAVAWQALEARSEPTLRAGHLLARLVRRPRWLVATAVAAIGWPLQFAALWLAPLTVVQPTLAFGLVVLLITSAVVLHERIGALEIAGAAGVIAGVAVLTWAAPEQEDSHASLVALLAVTAPLALVAGRRGSATWPSPDRCARSCRRLRGDGDDDQAVSDGISTGAHVLAIVGWGA